MENLFQSGSKRSVDDGWNFRVESLRRINWRPLEDGQHQSPDRRANQGLEQKFFRQDMVLLLDCQLIYPVTVPESHEL